MFVKIQIFTFEFFWNLFFNLIVRMNNTWKESDFEADRTAIKHSFANIRNKSIIISIQKIASFKCYYGGCLQLKMSITDVMKFIKPIHEMIRTLNKTEKSQYLRDKIRSCLVFKEGYKNAMTKLSQEFVEIVLQVYMKSVWQN